MKYRRILQAAPPSSPRGGVLGQLQQLYAEFSKGQKLLTEVENELATPAPDSSAYPRFFIMLLLFNSILQSSSAASKQTFIVIAIAVDRAENGVSKICETRSSTQSYHRAASRAARAPTNSTTKSAFVFPACFDFA